MIPNGPKKETILRAIEEIERAQDEIAGIKRDIKEFYVAAEIEGIPKKALKKIMAERKIDWDKAESDANDYQQIAQTIGHNTFNFESTPLWQAQDDAPSPRPKAADVVPALMENIQEAMPAVKKIRAESDPKKREKILKEEAQKLTEKQDEKESWRRESEQKLLDMSNQAKQSWKEKEKKLWKKKGDVAPDGRWYNRHADIKRVGYKPTNEEFIHMSEDGWDSRKCSSADTYVKWITEYGSKDVSSDPKEPMLTTTQYDALVTHYAYANEMSDPENAPPMWKIREAARVEAAKKAEVDAVVMASPASTAALDKGERAESIKNSGASGIHITDHRNNPEYFIAAEEAKHAAGQESVFDGDPELGDELDPPKTNVSARKLMMMIRSGYNPTGKTAKQALQTWNASTFPDEIEDVYDPDPITEKGFKAIQVEYAKNMDGDSDNKASYITERRYRILIRKGWNPTGKSSHQALREWNDNNYSEGDFDGYSPEHLTEKEYAIAQIEWTEKQKSEDEAAIARGEDISISAKHFKEMVDGGWDPRHVALADAIIEWNHRFARLTDDFKNEPALTPAEYDNLIADWVPSASPEDVGSMTAAEYAKFQGKCDFIAISSENFATMIDDGWDPRGKTAADALDHWQKTYPVIGITSSENLGYLTPVELKSVIKKYSKKKGGVSVIIFKDSSPLMADEEFEEWKRQRSAENSVIAGVHPDLNPVKKEKTSSPEYTFGKKMMDNTIKRAGLAPKKPAKKAKKSGGDLPK